MVQITDGSSKAEQIIGEWGGAGPRISIKEESRPNPLKKRGGKRRLAEEVNLWSIKQGLLQGGGGK